ncbi:MBL fold metallo-hydrolase [Maribellus sediminis]|uniref:MBL fold metallo-hydrolase n=1 Tax=Maribellus sediminis TaxID=2696285 RepID=UPI00143115A6|nr:MBL fold metallo-hydrolase [Maribellus sediminis]
MKYLVLLSLTVLLNVFANAQTKVILLGTGTPNPDPDHAGSSVAILVNDNAYLVDFGAGLVRNAARMTPQYGGEFPQLEAKNLKLAFLTHLHSDHTIGLPDLLLTPWVLERDVPLELYGPVGTKHLADNIVEAYKADIDYRLNGLEPANETGWKVNTHEFEEDGIIYVDSLVKVEAFHVEHGSWINAFGFRFTTPDKTIVLSGDTRPCENILNYSKGADILVHEVYSYHRWTKRNEFWKKYHAANHTSSLELGELAAKTKPGKLVLYHLLSWGDTEEDLLNEIATKYDGEVIVGHDCMVIE